MVFAGGSTNLVIWLSRAYTGTVYTSTIFRQRDICTTSSLGSTVLNNQTGIVWNGISFPNDGSYEISVYSSATNPAVPFGTAAIRIAKITKTLAPINYSTSILFKSFPGTYFRTGITYQIQRIDPTGQWNGIGTYTPSHSAVKFLNFNIVTPNVEGVYNYVLHEPGLTTRKVVDEHKINVIAPSTNTVLYISRG